MGEAFLEVTGTAMGGGALKIEASHVRKIVFPRIENERKKNLRISVKKFLKIELLKVSYKSKLMRL